jgi:hypothetical protein
VELVGTITRLNSFVDKFIISLDDSTGAVTCCLWTSDSSWALHRHSLENNVLVQDQLHLGDIVRVRGKIRHISPTTFVDSVEVIIHSIQKEEDPNIELLHWLDVMSLDQIYRRPFEVPKQVMRLADEEKTLNDVVKSFLGFSTIQSLKELKIPIKTGIQRKGLPLAIPPFSAQSLLENNVISSYAAIQVSKLVSKGRNTTAETEIDHILNHLVDVGDILKDPDGNVIAYCYSAAERAQMDDQLDKIGSSYDPAFRPSTNFPMVLLTADLLLPLVYHIICAEYVRKSASEGARMSDKFMYGVTPQKVLELIKSEKMLPNLKQDHIRKAIDLLMDVDLVYPIQDQEFRPHLASSYEDI